MLKFLLLLSFAWADPEVVFDSDRASEMSDAITAELFPEDQNNTAYNELTCLRQHSKGVALFASEAAECNIKGLSPFLSSAFSRLKMGPKERALFYSQILVESGFLTNFTETPKLQFSKCGAREKMSQAMTELIGADGDIDEMNKKNQSKELKSTADPLGQLSQNITSDEHFGKAKTGAKHSANFGQFRGRGLIQITGCDNFLSTIHYLNLEYRGQNPYWQTSWHATEARPPYKKEDQIGAVCVPTANRNKLDEMQKIYEQKNPGMSLDLYGAVEAPERFAWLSQDFQDAKLKRGITGEKFMVDATMAYWRGRCGATVQEILRNPRGTSSDFCPAKLDRQKMTDEEIVSRCIVGCVKGRSQAFASANSTGGWNERMTLYRRALECVK